jgi:histone acetyltransferase 1
VADYYKDETAFLKRVEDDAANFKPFGDLIYSYTRPASVSSTKGKGTVGGGPHSSGPEVIEFQAYHVCAETEKQS